MTNAAFNIDLFRGTRTSHIVCSGELDVCAMAQLREVLDRSLEGSARTVLFNGAGVTLLTAEAVGVVVEAAFACRERNLNFEVILSKRGWGVVELLGAAAHLTAPPLDAPPPDPDYAIPRQVAQALRDVMGERDLYDAFFREGDAAPPMLGRYEVTSS